MGTDNSAALEAKEEKVDGYLGSAFGDFPHSGSFLKL